MKGLFFGLFCLIFASALVGGPVGDEAHCAYGKPAQLSAGVLKYDAFTVRQIRQVEYIQLNCRTSWWVYELEVLKDGRLTIGGNITFSSEERANARRFDVNGQIYVAEMYSSTSAELNTGNTALGSSRLYPGEIIIWDRESAFRTNPKIATIWEKEFIVPGVRYSSTNAYENGVYIDGFTAPPGKTTDANYRLERSSTKIERVPLLRDSSVPPDLKPYASEYGVRQRYRQRLLRFSEFDVALVQVWDSNPFVPALHQRLYFFKVFERDGRQVAEFSFNTGTMANGYRFEVKGVKYLAEMFFSTANVSVESNIAGTSLREDELIVWDTPTAKQTNPRGLAALTEVAKVGEQGSRVTTFAGGRKLNGAFTGTYMWSKLGMVPSEELDAPVTLNSKPQAVYPVEYSGSGLIGDVHGMIFIKEDGSVDHVMVTHGNDTAFEDIPYKALATACFAPPTKNGRPCKTYVNFSWIISEPIVAAPVINE